MIGGGGCFLAALTVPVYRLWIDLDTSPPAISAHGLDPLTDTSNVGLPFALGRGESAILYIDAFANRATYSWVLEISYVLNGTTGTTVVPADGSTFVTSGQDGNPFYAWSDPQLAAVQRGSLAQRKLTPEPLPKPIPGQPRGWQRC
jgi:hypothetical protein